VDSEAGEDGRILFLVKSKLPESAKSGERKSDRLYERIRLSPPPLSYSSGFAGD